MIAKLILFSQRTGKVDLQKLIVNAKNDHEGQGKLLYKKCDNKIKRQQYTIYFGLMFDRQ